MNIFSNNKKKKKSSLTYGLRHISQIRTFRFQRFVWIIKYSWIFRYPGIVYVLLVAKRHSTSPCAQYILLPSFQELHHFYSHILEKKNDILKLVSYWNTFGLNFWLLRSCRPPTSFFLSACLIISDINCILKLINNTFNWSHNLIYSVIEA